ncbi:reverse transcriptase-like protein [Sphingomonas sp. ID0503]|uniref:reverse transcriptase-like protein n=1 Tax=Sphingomonas sp. ID0503 TaxID=3399691 RepID=UPI003AFA731E
MRGVTHVQPAAGTGTNSDAEWLALIHAAHIAVAMGAEDVEFVGDSALVVDQANGALCRSDTLKAHQERYRSIVENIPKVRLRRVPRSKNLAGIALEQRRRF